MKTQLSVAQMEWLVRKMVEVAEAVNHDHEYRHSDYAGMEVYNLTKDSSLVADVTEFNTLEEQQ